MTYSNFIPSVFVTRLFVLHEKVVYLGKIHRALDACNVCFKVPALCLESV